MSNFAAIKHLMNIRRIILMAGIVVQAQCTRWLLLETVMTDRLIPFTTLYCRSKDKRCWMPIGMCIMFKSIQVIMSGKPLLKCSERQNCKIIFQCAVWQRRLLSTTMYSRTDVPIHCGMCFLRHTTSCVNRRAGTTITRHGLCGLISLFSPMKAVKRRMRCAICMKMPRREIIYMA